MMHKHEPSSYKPGDPIFIRVSRGWHRFGARRYIVDRLTPSGQIIAKEGDYEIRITPRGSVTGSDQVVIDQETAERLREGERIDAAWYKVSQKADAIQHLSHQRDVEGLRAALVEIEAEITRLQETQA